MKKSFFFILLTLFFLSSCVNSSDNLEEEYPTEVFVVMEIKTDTIDTEGCTLVIYNKGQQEIYFGTEYTLMKLLPQGKGWSEIKCQGDWTGELYNLKAGDKKEISIRFAEHFGKLPVGKYKLIKTINGEFLYDTDFEVR